MVLRLSTTTLTTITNHHRPNHQLSPARRSLHLLLYLYVFFCSQRALSTVVALGAHVICSKMPGLSPQQRAMCQARPDALVAVGRGAALGLDECQHQFSGHRWNCSSPRAQHSLFGHHHAYGTREAAYSSAITSAGVAYAVTQACSQGNLLGCGCDASKTEGKYSPNGFKWAGCSVDWKYGLHFAGKFLDAGEVEENSRTLMNLHNHNAGRKVLKDKLALTCKCHGTSGSCTIKSCWQTLPSFHEIGSHLRNKYKRAKHVIPVHGRRALKPLYLKVKTEDDVTRKPRRRDLVYLHTSPNYCDFNYAVGSMGTRGRECDVRGSGEDNCDILCCGRGFDMHEYTRIERCNCQFHWCCYVTCDNCTKHVTVYTCR